MSVYTDILTRRPIMSLKALVPGLELTVWRETCPKAQAIKLLGYQVKFHFSESSCGRGKAAENRANPIF